MLCRLWPGLRLSQARTRPDLSLVINYYEPGLGHSLQCFNDNVYIAFGIGYTSSVHDTSIGLGPGMGLAWPRPSPRPFATLATVTLGLVV